MKKFVFCVMAIFFSIAPFISWGHSIVASIRFNADCAGYLTLAADANSVDIAEKHLSTAIDYLERNNITSGYNKIFVYKPGNDVGLWYENLKSAQDQLQTIQNTDYTELEESNMLMKLRETLLNNGGSVTVPLGVECHGHYSLVFWFNCILWLPCWALAFVLWFLFCEE